MIGPRVPENGKLLLLLSGLNIQPI